MEAGVRAGAFQEGCSKDARYPGARIRGSTVPSGGWSSPCSGRGVPFPAPRPLMMSRSRGQICVAGWRRQSAVGTTQTRWLRLPVHCAGATYGASAVPEEWRLILHGWPGKSADDLVAMALRMHSDYERSK